MEANIGGVSNKLKSLGDIIERIRIENEIRINDKKDIRNLTTEITNDFWGAGSYLNKQLKAFIAPLNKSIFEALNIASDTLEPDYGLIWSRYIENYKILIEKNAESYVLMHRDDLVELLKNLFINVRYNLTKSDEKDIDIYSNVEIQIKSVNEIVQETNESMNYKYITIRSWGKALEKHPDPGSTFQRHKTEVADLGGLLSIDILNDSKGVGAEVILKLIDRNVPPYLKEQGDE